MARLIPVLSVVALSLIPLNASAQAGSAPRRPELQRELIVRNPQYPTELDQQNAQETREELRRLMELYPPALGQVLRLDPNLMTNAAYMAPYPALTTFLQRHPEVPRYPAYFMSFISEPRTYEARSPELEIRSQALQTWQRLVENLVVFAGFGMAIFTVTWLIKYMVGHRRWLRAMKIQSEVHGRLMERLSSNEELLAYVQSPAGKQFLQAGPVTVDAAGSAAPMAAPFGRILWSIQAGLALFFAGLGMLYVKQYVYEEVAVMLLLFGVLALGVGLAFGLAAGASYMLSQRLGLFDARRDGGTNAA